MIIFNNLDCHGPLGMQNGAISNGQLQASTEWDAYLSIPQGRLNHPRCWAARFNDANQWYQVDLGSQYIRVTSVATQGRGDHPQWVTSYKLQYGNDGVNFQYYREQGQATDKVNQNPCDCILFTCYIIYTGNACFVGTFARPLFTRGRCRGYAWFCSQRHCVEIKISRISLGANPTLHSIFCKHNNYFF